MLFGSEGPWSSFSCFTIVESFEESGLVWVLDDICIPTVFRLGSLGLVGLSTDLSGSERNEIGLVDSSRRLPAGLASLEKQ